jgi:hypothetical protein
MPSVGDARAIAGRMGLSADAVKLRGCQSVAFASAPDSASLAAPGRFDIANLAPNGIVADGQFVPLKSLAEMLLSLRLPPDECKVTVISSTEYAL